MTEIIPCQETIRREQTMRAGNHSYSRGWWFFCDAATHISAGQLTLTHSKYFSKIKISPITVAANLSWVFRLGFPVGCSAPGRGWNRPRNVQGAARQVQAGCSSPRGLLGCCQEPEGIWLMGVTGTTSVFFHEFRLRLWIKRGKQTGLKKILANNSAWHS